MTLPAFIFLLAFTRLASSENFSFLANKLLDASIMRLLMDSTHERISASCKEALGQFEGALSTSENWAVEMADASGKIPSGVLTGSSLYLGAYDECLNISFQSSVTTEPNITGKYCAVILNPNTTSSAPKMLEDTYRWDLCVPDQCTPQDLEYGLSSISETYAISVKVPFCSVNTWNEYSVGQTVSLVILLVLALFVVGGTITDYLVRLPSTDPDYKETPFHKFFEAFSVYSNALRLLDTTERPSELTALHGLKVMATLWMIVAHSYHYIDWALIGYTEEAKTLRTSFLYQSIMSSSMSVDTFFFVSGVLVVYHNLKMLYRTATNNWCRFYLHRYCRMTPAYAFLIVVALLWPRIASGPFWATATSHVPYCEKNWWANLLYINNFYGVEEPCFEHAWYMAADMQFYLVSSLIIYILWSWTKLGLGICGSLVVISCLSTAFLGINNDLLPTSIPFADEKRMELMIQMYKLVFVKPYCRMGPYIIGMVTGYMITSTITFQLHLVVKSILWCVSIALTSLVLYGIYNWNAGDVHHVLLDALYLACHRTVWTIPIAWLTYACVFEHAGIVNSFLSWKPFKVLSRLSFMAYLIHVVILRTFSGLMGNSLIFSGYVWIVIILGLVTVIYVLSFILVVCVEEPFHRFESMFLPSGRERFEEQFPPVLSANRLRASLDTERETNL